MIKLLKDNVLRAMREKPHVMGENSGIYGWMNLNLNMDEFHCIKWQ